MPQVRRTSHTMLVSLILLAFVLGACSSSSTAGTPTVPATPDTAPTPTTVRTPIPTLVSDVEPETHITIWLSWDRAELSALQERIDAFQADAPQVGFSIRYAREEDLLEAFMQAQQDDPHPALLLGPAEWALPLREEGLILDLTELVDAELMSTVSMLGWRQVTLNEQIIGLPLELQGMVLYRNTALASEAPRTVSAWIEAARSITEGGGVASVLDLTFETSASHLTACGETLFHSDGTYGFSGDSGVCWLELLQEIGRTGQVSFGSTLAGEAFAAGNAAWWMGSSGELRHLNQVMGSESVAIDAWPLSDATGDPMAGFVWSENIYISSAQETESLEAAWRFSRFLLTPDSQRLFSDPGGAAHIPVLEALNLTDSQMASASAAVQSGVPYPTRTDLDVFIRPLEEAVFDTLVQGRAPIDAIEAAEDSIEFGLSILSVGGELPQEEPEEP